MKTIRRDDFASDTVAAACPEVMAALLAANEHSYAASYGEDELTYKASRLIEERLGRPCTVFFVSSGTAANAIALALLARSEEAVVCHRFAHIQNDEANAPELYTGGAKLLLADGPDGKVTPESVRMMLEQGRGYHSAAVSVLSLTQATELGTIYSADEMRQLAALKQEHPGLKVHLDGARLANAVAAYGSAAAALIQGADALAFGGSKNGGTAGEAIVLFDDKLRESSDDRDRIKRRLKRFGHLAAKARYLSAPWIGLLQDDVWLKNAGAANRHAKALAGGFTAAGLELAVPVETNQVFVRMPQALAAKLEQHGWQFHLFPMVGAYRFVCSWSTTDDAVAELLELVAAG